MNITAIRYYIDYFLPREVLGPVILVFSAENVVDILFRTYIPQHYEFAGWFIILLLSIAVIGYWGEADEDMEDLEEALDDASKD